MARGWHGHLQVDGVVERDGGRVHLPGVDDAVGQRRLQRVDDDDRVVGRVAQRPQPDLTAEVPRLYITHTHTHTRAALSATDQQCR